MIGPAKVRQAKARTMKTEATDECIVVDFPRDAALAAYMAEHFGNTPMAGILLDGGNFQF